MFTFFLLFTSLANAGDPYRCVATVAAPVPTCGVHGTFTVTAGAKTEAAATKAARSALAKALVKTAESFQLAQPAADPSELAGCSAVGDDQILFCDPRRCRVLGWRRARPGGCWVEGFRGRHGEDVRRRRCASRHPELHGHGVAQGEVRGLLPQPDPGALPLIRTPTLAAARLDFAGTRALGARSKACTAAYVAAAAAIVAASAPPRARPPRSKGVATIRGVSFDFRVPR